MGVRLMSWRRDATSWLIILLVLIIVASGAVYVLWPQLQPHTTVRLGDAVFLAKVAKTQTDRDQGLNGSQLSADQAFLMVYDSDDKWPVTLQGSPGALDIIWLNSDKQVIYIVKNAPPDSPPYTIYTPHDPARYVLEVPAGTVDQKSITINQAATFDENNIQGFQI